MILNSLGGEITLGEYDSCRLIAVNLFSFVDNPFTPEAKFNFNKFYEINYEAMRLSDDLVDLELEAVDKIINKIKSDPEDETIKQVELDLWEKVKEIGNAGRRTGLGFTALGDMIAALGFKYDSDEALAIVDKVMHIKMESELDCTTDLAILRGTFEGWDRDKEFNHRQAKCEGLNNFYQSICDSFPEQVHKMVKYGRRNISWSTVAPTGSVSLLSQTTSGIEPVFSIYPYTRRKKINPDDEGTRVDFTDESGDTWQEFVVIHPKLIQYMNTIGVGFNINLNADTKEEREELVTNVISFIDNHNTPWDKSTANDIDWDKRVEMQGIIQKYISHSISSTINLPEDVSEEEVKEIYFKAYNKGLKGITIYRDGSRSGVLISNNKKDSHKFEYNDAPKRPEILPCEIHTTVSKGVKWNVIVGLMEGNPYEVFAVPHFTNETNMELIKVKRGKYNLLKNGEIYVEDVTSEMQDEQEVVTRLISTSLRHGADIKFIVEQLNKSHGDITSFSKAIARTIKKYIPDGTKSTVSCNDCGSNNVVFEEGCNKCLDCGSSACG